MLDKFQKRKKKEPRSYKTWHNLVSVYSKCRLAFPSDKLAAISGLASRLHCSGHPVKLIISRAMEGKPCQRPAVVYTPLEEQIIS
jgi:hypothetical protein